MKAALPKRITAAILLCLLGSAPALAITAQDVTQKMSKQDRFNYLTGLIDMRAYAAAQSGEAMRSNVLTGETPFRRAYIRSLVDQVEVDDAEIRIHGRRTVLERLVMGGGAAPAGVPSFVRKWRARRDSNS